MKKAISVFLALVMCAALALPAFADAVGPFMEEITAYVNKKGGAKLYNYGEPDDEEGEWDLIPDGTKIPDKTKLTLLWPEVEDDDTYYYVDYGEEGGYVRASDLSMDLKPVEPKEENRYDPPRHFVVLNADGAKLYAGPGISYEELTVLPEGTEIEAEYADGYDDGSVSTWSYTTFDGVSGWVHTGQDGFSEDFGIPVGYYEYAQSPLGEIYVRTGMNYYDKMWWWDDDEPAGEIPADTELSFDRYYRHQGETIVPVNYDGSQVWIRLEDAYFLQESYMSAIDGYLINYGEPALYEDDNLQPGDRTDKEMPVNEIIPYDWAFRDVLGDYDKDDEEYYDSPYEDYYRVLLDGEYYWVRYGSEIGEEVCTFNGSYIEAAPEGVSVTVYAEPDDTSEELAVINPEEQYTCLFSYDKNDYYEDENGEVDYDPLANWYYVDFDGVRGWIHYGEEEYPAYLPALTAPVVTFGEAAETASATDDGNDNSEGGGFLSNLFGKKDGGDGSLEPESPRKTIGGSIAFAAVAVVLAIFGISRARKKKED